MCHGPETALQKQGDLRGWDGDEHVDDERDRREPGQDTDDDQQTAADFDDADEGRRKRRHRDTDLDEPAYAQSIREEKLLDSLGKENPTHQKTNEHRRNGRVGLYDSAEKARELRHSKST